MSQGYDIVCLQEAHSRAPTENIDAHPSGQAICWGRCDSGRKGQVITAKEPHSTRVASSRWRFSAELPSAAVASTHLPHSWMELDVLGGAETRAPRGARTSGPAGTVAATTPRSLRAASSLNPGEVFDMGVDVNRVSRDERITLW